MAVFCVNLAALSLTEFTAAISNHQVSIASMGFALIDGLDDTIGKAILVVWLVLFMGHCMRFERGFLESLGIFLGLCWIIELVVTAVALGPG